MLTVMKLSLRVRHVPAATALALIALSAGVDPSDIFDLDLFDFARRIEAARARRRS